MLDASPYFVSFLALKDDVERHLIVRVGMRPIKAGKFDGASGS